MPNTTQISAPGLTEEQLQAELAWLKEFNQASDSLDWNRWQEFWADDSFLLFGNTPKIEGKSAITQYFKEQLGYLDLMQHVILRHSFDLPLGLIYQTALVTYQIKGDPKGRQVEVPGIAVLHKQVGSDRITGFETYIDKEPLATIISEILGPSGGKST
ncbi:hypothetical protein BDV93DRAFT_522541 [Ceratobasidium sp. AG-I]|nr:hypothetical protein BDV93DRAFT_522541 [Ceratobasidium sp. AG-I]